jgi:hypothetical protein
MRSKEVKGKGRKGILSLSPFALFPISLHLRPRPKKKPATPKEEWPAVHIIGETFMGLQKEVDRGGAQSSLPVYLLR